MDPSVLFVSPYLRDARSLTEMLDEISIPVIHARGVSEAAAHLKTGRFSVVLTEANFDDGTWLDLLKLTKPSGIELVVTDAWADPRFWAAAINLGAYDLLAQPFHRNEVRRVLASVVSRRSAGFKVAAAS